MAYRVMVVEDDDLLREVTCEALEAHQLVVLSCASADDALTMLKSTPRIHLVITDIHMPGILDGNELAHLIHALWSDTAVIVTSGGSMVNPPHLPEGAFFLAKPWTIEQLLEAVQRQLQET